MFNKSEILDIDRQSKIRNYSFIYFFRPISILPTFIFYKFKLLPNQITYSRILIFLVLMFHPMFNLEIEIFTFFVFILFIQILDFCDGNLARIYNINNLYGKLIDGLGDVIIPLSYIYLSFYVNNFDLNNTISYLLFAMLILYFLSVIIELKLSLYRKLSKVSEKKSNANSIDKNIKIFIRSCLESIQSSHIIIVLIFVSLGYIYELVVILLILSFISFIDSLRAVIKIKNQLELIKYTNLSSFKE